MERSRVLARLRTARQFPITILHAAAGSGKSYAIREWLRADWPDHAIVDVAPGHATLGRFVQAIAEAFAARAPGARIAFASAYDRAVLSADPAHALAVWLHEHIRSLELTVVIDNLHHAESPLIQTFLGKLIDRQAPGLRWVIGCRSCEYLPVANWLASARVGLPVSEDDLAFTADEIGRFADERGVPVGAAEVADVRTRTNGWATGVSFLLQRGRRRVDAAVSAFEPVVEFVLAECDERMLRSLLIASYLPDLADELLEAVEGEALRETVQALRVRAPFLFVETASSLRFHETFMEALRVRAGAADAAERESAEERVAQALARAGRIVDQLTLRLDGKLDACVAILDRHGVELIERGDADLVDTAVGRLQRAGIELPARVLALRAIVDSRLGRMDTAEAWFNQAIARAEDDDERMIEVKYLYACDLLRRDRLDCLPLLREHIDDDVVSPPLRAAILSAYAEALQMAHRPEEARHAIETAMALEHKVGDAALHARVLARAAYVFLYQEDYERAESFARAAALAAEEASLYTVAIGAYSVLYVTAFDREDPLAALHHLDQLLESCLKGGYLHFQFYCLACAFEIEMERNNVAAVRRIDETLQSFDIYLGSTVSDEAFFPGDALRSALHGDFERAYRLLQPTAMHQAGNERVAQRWSEVALYAAAALRADDAADAAQKAGEALALAGALSARSARARLYLALAIALLGRSDESQQLLAQVERAEGLPERIATLALGFGALCRYAGGAYNYAEISAALAVMRERECGGIAKLLESLPIRERFLEPAS